MNRGDHATCAATRQLDGRQGERQEARVFSNYLALGGSERGGGALR
jgi:hypothetical protein